MKSGRTGATTFTLRLLIACTNFTNEQLCFCRLNLD